MPNRYNNSYWEEYHKGDAPFQFPVWAIIAGFVAWWPLGFIFLGVNEYSRRQGLRAPTRRQTATAPELANGPLYEQAQPPKAAPKRARPQKKETNTLFVVLLIVGAVLTLTGTAAIFDALDMFFWALGEGGWASAAYWLEDAVSSLLPLGLGIGSLLAAFTSRADSRIRKKIVNIVGNADHMYIKEIAEAIPCTQEKCCKHLEKCIDKGVFGDSAYLDMRTKCLVVRGPAPAPKPKAQPPKPKAEKKPEGNEQYQAILDELRRVNDAIPDEKLSEKISRLETVSARIFRQVEADPKKLPQMRKFMDYYLPTSLKLLNTYAELDAQGVEGENITLSKRRIEQAMDTVVVAFENQLDQLFRADAMDVSADIEVMENMLRADGLAGEEPFQSPQLKL